MTYVITFSDYTPTPRMDGNPWTSALIMESQNQDGPWTQIDSIVFTDPDTDPTQPKTRSFTTDNATLASGWYQIIFEDAANHQLTTEPIQNVVLPRNEWLPDIGDVARLLAARTKDQYGNEVGTFNANTRPTNVQVAALINEVGDRVADEIGDDVPPQLWGDAAGVTAERVAMEIELAYFPEQVNTNRSPYNELKAQYEEDITRLGRQVQIVNEGGEPNAVDAQPSNKAQGSFPDATKFPPYGLGTQW